MLGLFITFEGGEGTMNEYAELSYDQVMAKCKDMFLKKTKDYGPSWLIFRLPSITDQMYIKAKRIRRIEELGGKHKVPENVDSEYIGIINYCIMALMKLENPNFQIEEGEYFENSNMKTTQLNSSDLEQMYDSIVAETKELMLRKNHDYAAAWREMRLSSIVDQILVKISRIKWIEEHTEQLLVSEGLDALYSDILNYSVFALMRLGLKDKKSGKNCI